ncbi:MAG: hypothetical protein GXN93_00735 [Candidatus Diapherotrites archaeon]|nr:hypothetical protein [Candidatus Diapherotrites archaeon]
MEGSEETPWKKIWLAFAVGVILSAPVFYILGSSMQSTNCTSKLQDIQEKYSMTSKALQAQISQNSELYARLQYLESSVKTLSKALETVSSQLSKVENSGTANGINVTTSAVHIVKPNFCINLTLKNTTNRQKIVLINIQGNGVSGNPQKISVYANGEKTVSVCGTLSEAAATAKITVDGEPATTTTLIMD